MGTANLGPLQHNAPISAQEYESELDVISSEVHRATYMFHMIEEINALALNDKDFLASFNEHALFWQANRSAQQEALFMGLSRIFDTDDTVHSVHRLVRLTISNYHLFSREEFGARKAARGIRPPWLDVALNEMWEPRTASDLRYLKGALKPHAAYIEAVYKPIRHQIYGHRAITDHEAGVALFPQTDRPTVGRVLDFLHDLVDSLSQLFLNGRQPVLGDRDYTNSNQRIRDEVRAVVRRLAIPIDS